MNAAASEGDAHWLARPALQSLLDVLRNAGFDTIGPVVRDGVLGLAPIESIDALPIGLRDAQTPGRYEIESAGHAHCFDVVHGAMGLKPHLFPPRETLLQIEASPAERKLDARPVLPEERKLAVFGMRACDIAALAIHDRVLLGGTFPDPWYGTRRESLFVVAVSCTRSASVCFCTSAGTGPEPTEGFDVRLTELDEGFVLRTGSPTGEAIVSELALPPAAQSAIEAERAGLDDCAREMDRRLDFEGARDVLLGALEHPRWAETGERCLSCGSCTAVCPTCFCHDQRDEPSIDASSSQRVREWSSCFDTDHGRIHGLHVRARTRDRYRQWLVHKLSTWHDQFGTSGCVGCGRCITWCPVGIDLVEEVTALAADPAATS